MITLISPFLILATSASLSFSQPPAIIHVGEEFKLFVYVSSGRRETLGTDAVIIYNPKLLSVTKILPGKAYPNYPPNLQDIDNVYGKTRISGIVDQGSSQVARGIFAEVYFRPKKPGTTQIGFAWQPGETEESNVVPAGEGVDLLTEKPSEVNLTIINMSLAEKILAVINKILSYFGL